MAGSEVPAIDGPAGQGRNQGVGDGAVVVLRSGVLVIAARARARTGGRSGLRASRGRVHSRPSSHRCVSSMSSTHWTMTRPGAGRTSSSWAPRRVLMSMHRLMAFSTVCGSMSFAPWWRRWGAAAPPSGTPSAVPFRPASSSRRRGTHARCSSLSVPVTEAGRRRPRSPPRRCHWCQGRAELVRRHRGHASHLGGSGAGGDGVVPAAGGFVYVDRAEPATHGRMWRYGWTVPAARRWCGRWPSRAAGASRGRRTPASPTWRGPAPTRRCSAPWRCSLGARYKAQRPVTTGWRSEAAEVAFRGMSPVGRIR